MNSSCTFDKWFTPSVRVTFDGNLFHPAEDLFRKVFVDMLHSYCLEQNRSI